MEKVKAFKISDKVTVNGFELKSWWGWNFVHIQVEGNKSYRCNGKLRIQFLGKRGRRG